MALSKYKLGELIKQRREKYDGSEELPIRGVAREGYYSDVGGAICLFTADDYGRAKNNATDNTRARQNVVLEAGYFMGKLGRNCVAILADKDIEMPSDLSGVVYTDSTNWEINLLKELKEMGYTIDFNKLF